MSNSNNSNSGIVLISRNDEIAKRVDNLLRIIRPLAKSSILKACIAEIDYYGQVSLIESPMGLWALYIKDSNGKPLELLLGWGYKPGVIAGIEPTSFWREDYRLTDITKDTVNLFKNCYEITHYGYMADYLSGAKTLEEIESKCNS